VISRPDSPVISNWELRSRYTHSTMANAKAKTALPRAAKRTQAKLEGPAPGAILLDTVEAALLGFPPSDSDVFTRLARRGRPGRI